jgi:predicted secreted protein
MLTAAAGLALLAAGCLGPPVVDVNVSAGSARLATGETLRVDFGDINESVGDSWHVVGDPDPAVLTEKERDYDVDCDQPGCGGHLRWTFTATGPGTTTVVFQYCYRSRPGDDCAPAPGGQSNQPVTLSVTVT